MRLRVSHRHLSTILLALAVTATSWGCTSTPTGPTPTGHVALQGPTDTFGAALAPASVSWGCFTSMTAGGFGASAGCAPRLMAQSLGVAGDVPLAPSNLARQVQGTTVNLIWSPPIGGDPATSYVIEAGSTAGASNITTFDTGNTSVTLTVTNVPNGTYFVRVRARNGSGTSAPSNEVIVVVGGPAPPPPPGSCAAAGSRGAPRELIGGAIGTAVALTWRGPEACDPDGYLIVVGSTPGANNVARVTVGPYSQSYSVTGAAPGTYYVFVRALNGAVSGAASNSIAVTVTAAAPPGATTWIGLVANGDGITIVSEGDDDCDIGSVVRVDSTATLVQSGSTVSGFVTFTIRSAPGCPGLVGFTDTQAINGTATGSLASGSGSFTAVSGTGSDAATVTATFANGRMTGSTKSENGETATFAMNRQQ